jgi:hypothetical protein
MSSRKKELSLADKALRAFRDAFRGVVLDHRERNLPLHIWQDGKVVAVSPFKVRLPRMSKEKREAIAEGRWHHVRGLQ